MLTCLLCLFCTLDMFTNKAIECVNCMFVLMTQSVYFYKLLKRSVNRDNG